MSLVSLKKSLEIDKKLYTQKPYFGMDIYTKDFEVNSCIVLENNGEGLKGIPIKCGYYELNLSSKRQINQFEYKISPHSLQLILEKDMHSFLYEKNSHEYIILFDENFLTKEIKELILFHREKLNNKKVVYRRQEELSNQFLSLIEELFLTKKPYKSMLSC